VDNEIEKGSEEKNEKISAICRREERRSVRSKPSLVAEQGVTRDRFQMNEFAKLSGKK